MSESIQSVPLSEFLSMKASAGRIPISGTFELSPVCNFACKMCYVRKTEKEVAKHERSMLSLEQWLKIAREAKDAGMLFLLITGGEPFLWPQFWELYEALSEMGFLITINTNASLIDDEVIRRLRKNPPKRLHITLYGASDATYEALCGVKGVFGKIDETIRKLKEAGILVKLNSSVTPSNVEDMEAIIQYAKEQDLRLDMATYMFPPIRRNEQMVGENHRFTEEAYARYHMKQFRLIQGEEKYLHMLKQIKDKAVPPPGLEESCRDPLDGKIRCRAGKSAFWITWDGFMTPCGMMPAPKVDLYENDFMPAWKQLVDTSEKISVSGVCDTCPNKGLCNTCAAIAMAETGSTEGIPTYLCKAVEVFQEIADKELRCFSINTEEKERKAK